MSILTRVLVATAALALVTGVGQVSARAQEEEMTTIPARPGESLISALRRVHPCIDEPGVRIPARVFEDNPEKMDANGNPVLVVPTLLLPKSFLDPDTQCGRIESEKKVQKLEKQIHSMAVIRSSKYPTAEEFAEAGQSPPQNANHLGLLATASYERVVSNFVSGSPQPVLQSGAQPGVALTLEHDFGPDVRLGVDYQFTVTSLSAQFGPATTALTHSQQAADLILRYRVTGATRFSLGAGYREITELSLGSDSQVLIDATPRIAGSFGVSHDFGTVADVSVSAALDANIFLPTTLSPALSGIGDRLRVDFETPLSEHWQLDWQLQGAYSRQQTHAQTYSDFAVGLGVGFHFQF